MTCYVKEHKKKLKKRIKKLGLSKRFGKKDLIKRTDRQLRGNLI